MPATIDVARYRNVVVLTGAGVSAASGLRTYRGPDGLWQDEAVRRLSEASTLLERPKEVWELFGALRRDARAAQPNAAHVALARAEARCSAAGGKMVVITQNVDRLHQRAGTRALIELHGTVFRTRCSDAACALPPYEDDTVPDGVPCCPQCGRILRPDVVLFDEPMPAGPEWHSKRALRDCDLFVAVGTSGSVSPASNFVRAAEYAGARTAFVNLEPLAPPNPAFQEQFLGPAEELLPKLFGDPAGP